MPRAAPPDAELVARIRAVLSASAPPGASSRFGVPPPVDVPVTGGVRLPAGGPSRGGDEVPGHATPGRTTATVALGTWIPPAPTGGTAPGGQVGPASPDVGRARARRAASVASGLSAASSDRDESTGPAVPGRPKIVSIPRLLASARVQVRPRAVAALLIVALVAGALLAVRLAVASRAAEPVPVAPNSSGLVGRSLPAGFTGLGVPASAQPPTPAALATASVAGGAPVVVHVVGHVARPGVVRLGAGARVLDAVEQAGGALADADLRRINLARPLGDGEQVVVPAPGEPIDPAGGGSGPVSGSGKAAVGGQSGPGPAPVNLNTADLAALDTLPGVGPVLAQRILDWRAEHGRFTSVEELGEVSGIGAKLLSQISPRVTL